MYSHDWARFESWVYNLVRQAAWSYVGWRNRWHLLAPCKVPYTDHLNGIRIAAARLANAGTFSHGTGF